MGVVVLLLYAVFVLASVFTRGKWNLDEYQTKIGGLVSIEDSLAGNLTCTYPECEVPSLNQTIPIIFDKSVFSVSALDESTLNCDGLLLRLIYLKQNGQLYRLKTASRFSKSLLEYCNAEVDYQQLLQEMKTVLDEPSLIKNDNGFIPRIVVNITGMKEGYNFAFETLRNMDITKVGNQYKTYISSTFSRQRVVWVEAKYVKYYEYDSLLIPSEFDTPLIINGLSIEQVVSAKGSDNPD